MVAGEALLWPLQWQGFDSQNNVCDHQIRCRDEEQYATAPGQVDLGATWSREWT